MDRYLGGDGAGTCRRATTVTSVAAGAGAACKSVTCLVGTRATMSGRGAMVAVASLTQTASTCSAATSRVERSRWMVLAPDVAERRCCTTRA